MVEKGLINMIAILESRLPLDKLPNMVQEIIQMDCNAEIYQRSSNQWNMKFALNWADGIKWGRYIVAFY